MTPQPHTPFHSLTSIIAEKGPLGRRRHRSAPHTDWLRVVLICSSGVLIKAPVPVVYQTHLNAHHSAFS